MAGRRVPPGRGRGRRRAVGPLLLPASLLVGVLAACQATASATPPLVPQPSPGATAAGETAVPTARPTVLESVRCEPDPGPIPAYLPADPCPSAILAVRLAVAPVRLPISRIVVEPGPFYCDVLWPGAQSAPACFGQLVRAGQFMHAWVAFAGTDRVAAVMLGRDLPSDETSPPPEAAAWNATLVRVEVPPAGWQMP